MKIDNPLSPQVSTGATSNASGITQSQSGPGGRGRIDGSSDQVQLSNLSAALRGLSAEDPERAAEVQKIAETVQSGSYRIDAVELGRKILTDSVEISQ